MYWQFIIIMKYIICSCCMYVPLCSLICFHYVNSSTFHEYIFISHKFYIRPSVITPVPKCECFGLPLSFNSLQNKQDFGLIVCICRYTVCRWRKLCAIYSAFRRSTWNRNAIYRNFNSPKFIGLDNFAYIRQDEMVWNNVYMCGFGWMQNPLPQNPQNYARHKFSVASLCTKL